MPSREETKPCSRSPACAAGNIRNLSKAVLQIASCQCGLDEIFNFGQHVALGSRGGRRGGGAFGEIADGLATDAAHKVTGLETGRRIYVNTGIGVATATALPPVRATEAGDKVVCDRANDIEHTL